MVHYLKNCANSWAIAAVESVESLLAIQTGKLIQLSAQELVDCNPRNVDAAPLKELVETAFRYICRVGVTTEHCYPYRGCYRQNLEIPKGPRFKIDDFVPIEAGEFPLMEAVAKQPVTALVDASSWERLHGWTPGQVFDGPFEKHNHAILVAGYDELNGTKYWIIKNSWGTGFADDGYILLKRGVSSCGIEKCAWYPVIRKKD